MDEQTQIWLADVVLALPKAKRATLSTQIEGLCGVLGVTQDLVSDQRKVAWSQGGSARKTVDERITHKVVWRDGGELLTNLETAAHHVRKKPASLRVYLSKGGGAYHTVLDEHDLVSVYKITDENLEPVGEVKPLRVEAGAYVK